MAWALSAALASLRAEVDAAHPGRSTLSDGTIGDRAHAARKSDHNPTNGIVHAWDVTRAPWTDAFVEWLRTSRDPRIKYVIFNGRMFSSYGIREWHWRTYNGSNPHRNHVHISVYGNNGAPWGYRTSDNSSWSSSMAINADSPAPHVSSLQSRLHEGGYLTGPVVDVVDGKWGPKTLAALHAWQVDHHCPKDDAFDEDDFLGLIVHGRPAAAPAPAGVVRVGDTVRIAKP